MKKISVIVMFFFTFLLSAQSHLKQYKKDALENINQINYQYKNGNFQNIAILFAKNTLCLVCDENTVGEDFMVENSKIPNVIIEMIPFLKLNKLRKSKLIYNQDDQEFSLGYQLAKPNPKTNFEGSGCLVYFKNEDGKVKISGIMTIP